MIAFASTTFPFGKSDARSAALDEVRAWTRARFGLSEDEAVLVTEMAGRFRLPDALKRVDQLARGLELPDGPPRELPRRVATSQARIDRGGARRAF